MKFGYIGLACAAMLTAGCSTTEGNPPSSGVATAAAVSSATTDRSAYVGTWAGTLGSGAAVIVRVPEQGNATYSFRGQNVPISGTDVSGSSMVLNLRSGGTVTMTPQGNSMGYSYRYGSDRAQTVLARR